MPGLFAPRKSTSRGTLSSCASPQSPAAAPVHTLDSASCRTQSHPGHLEGTETAGVVDANGKSSVALPLQGFLHQLCSSARPSQPKPLPTEAGRRLTRPVRQRRWAAD